MCMSVQMDESMLHLHPWYFGNLTRQQAERHLKEYGENEGSFLVRNSSCPGAWTVSVLSWDGSNCVVGHYLISRTARNEVCFDESLTFPGLADLIEYYRSNPGLLTIEIGDPCPKECQQPNDDYGYAIYTPQVQLPENEKFIKIRRIYCGSFGESWIGNLVSAPTMEMVAKFANDEEQARLALYHEVNMMKRLSHENIVRLHGTIEHPSFTIITHKAGDMSLLAFLLSDDGAGLTSLQELGIARQIASALDHCRSKMCVHRNVKAKSVIINSVNLSCKLASLKNCRVLDDYGYYHAIREEERNSNQITARVRWMSPEAARDGRFSTASDVWAFGILMTEIFTKGAMPYASYLTCKVLSEIEEGCRCPKPVGCNDEVYTMMEKCWSATEVERPSFKEIRNFLSKYISDNREQLSKLSPTKPTSANLYNLTHGISIKQRRTRPPSSPGLPPPFAEYRGHP